MTDDTAVKVVVRIRPQISRDILDLCHVCTKTVPNEPQIWIGNEKSYTFDKVFDMPTRQDEIFDNCVKDLVDGCFDGYNATVLAYGQTGSGKTYSMGTGFDHSFQLDERGIIPRAVERLFQKIEDIQEKEKEKGHTPPEFKVNAQFMELYNEEVIDLLDTTRDMDNKKKTHVKIHEDADGKIYTHGVIAQCVTNVHEALHCLKIGSLSRTTASTGMNTQSSRSHAIFTLHIKQQRVVKLEKDISGEETCNSSLHKHSETLSEFETLTAKFHFVDLAGSERLKRTGATGDRQKESICINSGLLALGNVISALGDKSKKATHVPYRDSKLTRLLQDSLGGNSQTLMIACVSPSDRDFVETLSTLKYANRAKNIRNKVTANMDKSSQTINALIKRVESLQIELMEFKQGKRIISEDGVECINDMYHENTMLQSENNSLKTRVKALQETIDRLTSKNTALLVEKQSGEWIISGGDGSKPDISALIQGYVTEIESLRAKLIEYEESCALLRKSALKSSPHSTFSPTSTVAITGHYDIRLDTSQSVAEVLEEAKNNVKRLKRKVEKEKKSKGKEKEGSDEEKDIADDAENEEDGQEDDGSSSGSDTEKTDQDEKLSENLAEITCDISLKEKLIRQLELTQKRLHNMRLQYEEKIAQLQTKILEAEKERDKLISNLSKTAESKSEEKRIRADYEKKISSLKNDVKNFESAKKHHVQLMASASTSEMQLKKLKQEVAEMKRTKVSLLNKMKEESKKYRDSELKRNKEIALLKREKLNKDSQIKALEAEKKRKEIVLRKRAEEIISLKKKVGRTASPRSVRSSRSGTFQLKVAKQTWQNLEKRISKLVLSKQNIAAIEKDMDHWLKEREKIGRCLDKVTRKRDRAIVEKKGFKVIAEFDDEIESLKANIEYIHENLTECQTAITGLEEAKENMNLEDILNTLNSMRLEESFYVIEKIVNMIIEQSFQNSQKEVVIKELESQLSQVIENNAVQEQLLYHVVQQTNEHLAGFIELNAANVEELENSESDSQSRSPSPDDSMPSFSRESSFVSDKPKKRKARNIAATTEQLLFSSNEPPSNSALEKVNSNMIAADGVPAEPPVFEKTNGDFNGKSVSYVVLPALSKSLIGENPIETPSEDKSLSVLEFKPVITGNGIQSAYLTCSHIVEGHKSAVLGIECTDDVMFSCCEGGLVKIWDLSTCTEIQKLTHVDAVKKVCYCEYTRRAFTASASDVALWDVRQNPAVCKHIFRSGFQDHTNEYQLTDIALNQYGTLLYAASSRSIRICDLRMLQCIGALDVGYGCNVSRIVVNDTDFKKNRIVCGSGDRSIKVFEIMEDDFGLHVPKFNLDPPHYDGIQSLAISDQKLLSGSRDTSIKMWDLEKRCLEYTLCEAHNSWVCSLNVLQDYNCFLSGCQSGYLKMWTLDKCKFLEDIKAHRSSINSIASNSSLIFTASSDCTIGVWKLKDGANSSFF